MKTKRKAPKKLPVMIRVEKGRGKGAHIDDLTAVFPTEPGTNEADSMLCYARLGEHSACNSAWVRFDTRNATKAEAAPMLRLLRGRDYKNLVVVKRLINSYYKTRRAALAR